MKDDYIVLSLDFSNQLGTEEFCHESTLRMHFGHPCQRHFKFVMGEIPWGNANRCQGERGKRELV